MRAVPIVVPLLFDHCFFLYSFAGAVFRLPFFVGIPPFCVPTNCLRMWMPAAKCPQDLQHGIWWVWPSYNIIFIVLPQPWFPMRFSYIARIIIRSLVGCLFGHPYFRLYLHINWLSCHFDFFFIGCFALLNWIPVSCHLQSRKGGSFLLLFYC